jgi:CHASE2 domain-containing sensor protein
MNLKLHILSRIGFATEAFSDLLARKWKRNFYVYLAVLFTLFALLDTAFLHITSEIRTVTFDAMVRYRLAPSKPDPSIVIVDINEASLAAMSKKYGRWPWPRQVLGEFVEQVEKQHPTAVVFDIMFSDADVFNAKSDAYFDASIAKTRNTFFPMLLLGDSDDSLRQVKISQIPGVLPIADETQDMDATINILLPHFKSVIDGGRLGTQNVILDSDGVVRNYPVYSEGYGFKVPSIPARLGREFGWPEPSTNHMLLNWRGKPFSYKYVGFSEVYQATAEQQRPKDEFKDKIIIIGSTAPNLYDVRTTPMAEMHPGVEVLATAIDNYKHGDSLRFPEGRFWYLLITLSIIWLTAWAFFRKEGRGNIDQLFGFSQFILIGFSFASINFSNTYINLAGPVMLGIAYFTLARLYAKATEEALEQNTVKIAVSHTGELRATLLLFRFDTKLNVVSDGMMGKIRLGLKRIGLAQKSVEVITGAQKGIWGLFDKTIAISWVAEAADEAAQQAIRDDVDLLLKNSPALLRRMLLNLDGAVSHVLHQGNIRGGEHAEEGWRRMFAEALLKWPEQRE